MTNQEMFRAVFGTDIIAHTAYKDTYAIEDTSIKGARTYRDNTEWLNAEYIPPVEEHGIEKWFLNYEDAKEYAYKTNREVIQITAHTVDGIKKRYVVTPCKEY